MNLMVMSLVFGLSLVAAAVAMVRVAGKGTDWWRKLPRERNVGTAVGLVALIWASRIALPMLEGGLSKYQGILVPAAVALGIACWFLLEFVLARAIGGLVILVAAMLMQLAFVGHAPARWVLSLSCYIVGTAGLVMIGWPWVFRDWLERIELSKQWRAASAGSVAVAGLAIAIVGLLHGLR